jgi:predicted Zn-ribbon and HTH transcriptional regulator
MEDGRINLLNMRKDQCPECLGYNTETVKEGAEYVSTCNDCYKEWIEGWG